MSLKWIKIELGNQQVLNSILEHGSRSVPWDVSPNDTFNIGQNPHNFPRSLMTWDMGGSGDCFFRSLNLAIASKSLTAQIEIPKYKISSLYQFIGLPLNEFIEEKHVPMICNLLDISIRFYVITNGRCDMMTIGNSGKLIEMVEYEHQHFLPVVYLDFDLMSSFLESGMRIKPVLLNKRIIDIKAGDAAVSEVVAETVEVDSVSSYEGSETDIYEIIDDQELDVVPDLPIMTVSFPISDDPSVFLPWIVNLDNVIFNNTAEVLSCFEYMSSSLPQILDILSDKNKSLNADMVKRLYKFRHNVFAAICLSYLNKFDGRLGTDVLLSDLGIETRKTPDAIVKVGDKYHVIEFTVSSKWENVYFTKGGGIMSQKYRREIEMLKSKGMDIELHILAAVFEDRDLMSILKNLENIIAGDGEFLLSDLRKFFSICSKINPFLSSSYAQADYGDLEIPKDFLETYNESMSYLQSKNVTHSSPKYRIVCISADVASSILRTCNRTADNLRRISHHKGDEEGVILTFDIVSGRGIRWSFAKKGANIPIIISKLASNDLSTILPLINFKRNGNPIGLNEISGQIPITILSEIKPKPAFTRFDFNLPFEYNMFSDTSEISPYTFDRDFMGTGSWVPDNYRGLLLSKDYLDLLGRDKDQKLLANNVVSYEIVEKAVVKFSRDQLISESPANLVHHVKPTFTYPFTSSNLQVCSLEELPVGLMKFVASSVVSGYTSAVLGEIIDHKFRKYVVPEDDRKSFEIRREMSKLNTKLYNLLKSHVSEDLTTVKRVKNAALMSGDRLGIREDVMLLNGQLSTENQKYRKMVGDKSNARIETRLVKVNCNKNTPMNELFRSELSHFHRNGSQFLAVDREKVEEPHVIEDMRDLIGGLLIGCNDKLDFPLFNTESKPDLAFLNDIKKDLKSQWGETLSEFSKTPCFHSAVLTYSLCKTLFKESCKTYNRHFLHVDNLGFQDVFVIVRGGKKIFTKQVSRMFRICYPLTDRDFKHMGYESNINFKRFHYKGKGFVMSPWMQLHQDVLYDGMTLIFRIFSYLNSVIINQKTGISSLDLNDLLPIALAMSNRRKTEQFMHNMRYLMVNPFGCYSNISELLKGFNGVNYTYLDFFLRRGIMNNYTDYIKRVENFKNSVKGRLEDMLMSTPLICIYTRNEINNPFKLVNTIYSTYLMTKAPVNPTLEQASNLLPILKDISLYDSLHSDVNWLNDESQNFSVLNLDSMEDSYNDDFKYDPVYCQHLGQTAASFFDNVLGKVKISNMWSSCLTQPFDKMANSNGLRGYDKSNFFNKKGYEVVYQFLSDKTDVRLTELVEAYMASDNNLTASMMKADNYTFKRHYQNMSENDKILDQATFHIVDKIQRGGGREIFVMDIKTKAVQYPMEQFFKKLCKYLPNEMISVPSNKRSNVVHSMFFEKMKLSWVKETIRWVLDCRRWAPHSVMQKYVHFIYGMRSVLPKNFIAQFMFMCKKMTDKRFIIRPKIFESIRKNKTYEGFLHYLKKEEQPSEMYSMPAKFSFVMGIFNYLSSMLHAVNQISASEVIRQWHMKRSLGLVNLTMNAHSDDSAGVSFHEKPESVLSTIVIYDWFLKGANHMLSVKKSQTNKNLYFEFLSILYMQNQMLPVTPKFISSMPFKPSDNGYSSDLMFAVSQSIEAFSQGCSQSESYLLMKLAEKFVQLIYNLKTPTCLSPQFLGGVDSFPLEYMLGGPLTDMWKDITYNKDNFDKAVFIYRKIGALTSDDVLVSTKWDMKARLGERHIFDVDVSKINENLLKSWFMENCKSSSPYINILWYSSKLSDRKYVASLINEPESRRYSRIFGSAVNRDLIMKNGSKLPVSELYGLFANLDTAEKAIIDTSSMDRVVTELVGELTNFHDSVRTCDYDRDNIISINRSIKPIRLVASFGTFGSLKDVSANEYIVYKTEPEYFKLFGKEKDIKHSVDYIDKILETYMPNGTTDPDACKLILNKITGRDNKTYNFINGVSSSVRNLLDHEAFLTLFSESLYPNKKLTIDYKRAVSIDKNNSYSRRGVPLSVKNLINCQSANDFFVRWKVDKLDIFKNDMQSALRELRSCVPLDWLPYVYNEYLDDTLMIDNYFWSMWIKEQKRWGREWVGEGSILLNLPECPIRVDLLNDAVRGISIGTTDFLEFSQMSCWYIGAIFDKDLHIMSMMSTPLSISENTVVLGYNFSKRTWGVGYNRGFDQVFDCVTLNDDLLEPCLYDKVKFKLDKSGHQIVSNESGREFRIKRILDSEFDKFTDIAPFLDPSKLLRIKNKTVKKMCYECALIQGKDVKYDMNTLLDNIGRSSVYDICFKAETADKILSGDIVSDSFLNALLKNKKDDDSFGFPSEEEIVNMSSNPWTGSMPVAVQEYAYKLGSKALTEDEMEYIYGIVQNYGKSDPERALAEMKMLYGETAAVQTLVSYMVKDTRLFKLCFMLGVRSRIGSIHSDMMRLISWLLSNRKFHSELLKTRARYVSKMFKKKISEIEVFENMYSKAVCDCTVSFHYQHRGSKTVDQVIGVINDILGQSEPTDFMGFQFDTDMMRSTDFHGDIGLRDLWVCDIFDSLCQTNTWGARENLKFRDFLECLKQFGPIAGIVGRSKYQLEDSISFETKDKRKTRLRYNKKTFPRPGFIMKDFIPLNEDDTDDYQYSIGVEEVPEDEVDPRSPGTTEKFSFLHKNLMTIDDARRIRGTAWELFVATNVLSKEFARLNNVRLYKKVSFKGYRDYLFHEDSFIVYFGTRRGKLDIVGYKELRWEEKNRAFNWKRFNHDFFWDVDGETYEKSIILEDPYTVNEVSGRINAIWGRTRLDPENTEIARTVLKDVKKCYDSENPLTEKIEKYFRILNKSDKPSDDKGTVITDDIETLIDEILKSVNSKDFIESALKSESKEKRDLSKFESLVRNKPTNYRISKEIQILTDARLRSELETLSPGMCRNLFTSNSMLTKKSKQRLMKISMRNVTTEKKKELKDKKARVHLVIMTILGSIVETEFEQHEDLKLYRDLSGLILDLDEESSIDQMPSLLEIEPLRDDVEISIDYNQFLETIER
ncbi:RNA-dependent RNA polymerase [Phytophthora condilina negative stranded RNA virus 9]|nr:RNA-dependent RNA polymerase [Phytophthora condilina negative stranded RNA virus 9]